MCTVTRCVGLWVELETAPTERARLLPHPLLLVVEACEEESEEEAGRNLSNGEDLAFSGLLATFGRQSLDDFGESFALAAAFDFGLLFDFDFDFGEVLFDVEAEAEEEAEPEAAATRTNPGSFRLAGRASCDFGGEVLLGFSENGGREALESASSTSSSASVAPPFVAA